MDIAVHLPLRAERHHRHTQEQPGNDLLAFLNGYVLELVGFSTGKDDA